MLLALIEKLSVSDFITARINLSYLHCHGCFLNTEINETAKYPKLLPRQVRFTHLLIMEVHERLIQAGIAYTLA